MVFKEGQSQEGSKEPRLNELMKEENLKLVEEISSMNKFDGAKRMAEITEADPSQAEVINTILEIKKTNLGEGESLLNLTPEKLKNLMEQAENK